MIPEAVKTSSSKSPKERRTGGHQKVADTVSSNHSANSATHCKTGLGRAETRSELPGIASRITGLQPRSANGRHENGSVRFYPASYLRTAAGRSKANLESNIIIHIKG